MPKRNRASGLIELDGRTLEGGGQLIRNALCLSALTGTAFKITNIRGNRPGGGGLKAQHLACVKWLARACGATVAGAEKPSKVLTFQPASITGATVPPSITRATLNDGREVYQCRLDIGTAGSTGLALQAVLPFLLFTRLPLSLPIRLTLSGGTNVPGSPSYEYIKHALLPTLHNIGLPSITLTLSERGWSHGGASIGSFTMEIPPWHTDHLPTFCHNPISGRSRKPSMPLLHAIFIGPARCHEHLRTVLDLAVRRRFGDSCVEGLSIDCEDSRHDKRLYLIMIATVQASEQSYVLARDWLYDRKITRLERSVTEMAEKVTKDVANEWLTGSWVDEHMRDQTVVFQALARGRSKVFAGTQCSLDENEWDSAGDAVPTEPSLHARTAEWVAKQMLDVTFNIDGCCEGVGFTRRLLVDPADGLSIQLDAVHLP